MSGTALRVRLRQTLNVLPSLALFGGVALYVALNVYLYDEFLVRYWAYYGFVRDLRWDHAGIAMVLVTPLVLHTCRRGTVRLTRFMMMFFQLHFVIPLALLTVLAGRDVHVLYAVVVACVIMSSAAASCAWLFGQLRTIPRPARPRLDRALETFSIRLGLLIVLGTVLTLWYATKGRYLTLDLTSVYDVRREVFGIIADYKMTYLMNWVTKAINPFLIIWAVARRRWWVLAWCVALQAFLFALTTHKSVLFYPVFALFAAWAMAGGDRVALRFVLGSLALVGSCAWATWYHGDNFFSSLFFRRVLYLPAHVTFVYFDFFERFGHVMFSNSFLSSFFQYPFEDRFTIIIGEYLGFQEMSANNGMISTGFMHLGIAGVIVYSVLFGALMGMCEAVSRPLRPWLAGAIVFVPFREVLISSDLMTGLLTHGAALSFLLLALASRFDFASRPTRVGAPRTAGSRHVESVGPKSDFAPPPAVTPPSVGTMDDGAGGLPDAVAGERGDDATRAA